jgi:hypothetical protein
MLPDLAGLLAALNTGGVRFVVIGGVAVGAHGHIRATEDVDIVPDPDRENLDRLGNVLVGLDARLASDPTRTIDPELRHAVYTGRNLTLSTARVISTSCSGCPACPPSRSLTVRRRTPRSATCRSASARGRI